MCLSHQSFVLAVSGSHLRNLCSLMSVVCYVNNVAHVFTCALIQIIALGKESLNELFIVITFGDMG